MIFPFHLAIRVKDLDSTRRFYGELLQCREGRSTDHWVDFDFFGHQMSAHVMPDLDLQLSETSVVDECDVPIPHFGVVLSWTNWLKLKQRLETQAVIPEFYFLIPPKVRFEGANGEQGTMFFYDLSGNALEFKAFRNVDELFAS